MQSRPDTAAFALKYAGEHESCARITPVGLRPALRQCNMLVIKEIEIILQISTILIHELDPCICLSASKICT
jgi:hypothetical protein